MKRINLADVLDALAWLSLNLGNPTRQFHSNHYLRHNARRLEHLASLRIPVAGLTVLEVGAGIGDHSHYYLDRGCALTITDFRQVNIAYLKKRYPGADIRLLDMDDPHPLAGGPFDIVHCYGLLYHLNNPLGALEFMSTECRGMLFLETCVSFGKEEKVVPVKENPKSPTQSITGSGCQPTRPWVFTALRRLFEYVYIPRTQPNHEEFPLDWTSNDQRRELSRSIFIASRRPLDNDVLSTEFLDHQARHE